MKLRRRHREGREWDVRKIVEETMFELVFFGLSKPSGCDLWPTDLQAHCIACNQTQTQDDVKSCSATGVVERGGSSQAGPLGKRGPSAQGRWGALRHVSSGT